MKYVALLRGINVGGKNQVAMPRLKEACEATGCQNVKTYINSGNVLFEDTRKPVAIKASLEGVVWQSFGFQVPIILRSQTNIAALCDAVPEEWKNDVRQKTDVMFLWDEINTPDIMQAISFNPSIEEVRYIDGALVWNINRKYIARGAGIKLIKTDYYQLMTVRNINTVRKLHELLGSLT